MLQVPSISEDMSTLPRVGCSWWVCMRVLHAFGSSPEPIWSQSEGASACVKVGEENTMCCTKSSQPIHDDSLSVSQRCPLFTTGKVQQGVRHTRYRIEHFLQPNR